MKTQTLNHFYKAIETGKFIPLSQKEIEEIVDEIYFAKSPIIPLTEQEKTTLKGKLVGDLNYSLNDNDFKILTEEPIFYFFAPEEKEINSLSVWPGHNFIYISNDFEDQRKILKDITAINAEVLTKKRKQELFSDIDIRDKNQFCKFLGPRGGSFTNSFGRYGERDLFGEWGYGFSHEEMKTIIERIKRRNGSEKIQMLDVGGMLGRACYDAETHFDEISATNLTVNEEPAMFPVKHILAPAERMPKYFKENFDLILSNMAFRYFTYQSLGLENCLQALSVGGEAYLSIETPASPDKTAEGDSLRLAKEYKRLKELDERGYIDLRVRSYENVFEYKPKSSYFPAALVEITKIKSLEDLTE